jgi:hypothetical protein
MVLYLNGIDSINCSANAGFGVYLSERARSRCAGTISESLPKRPRPTIL